MGFFELIAKIATIALTVVARWLLLVVLKSKYTVRMMLIGSPDIMLIASLDMLLEHWT